MLLKISGETYFYKYKRKIYESFRLFRNYSTKNNKLKVLFFGSDSFSLPSIEALHKSRLKSFNNSKVSSVGVVTSFKNPVNCIKCYAEKNNLKTFKWPVDVDTCMQYDMGVVVSFGHLIPSNRIKAFPLGMINVHASILPRWRGAAPIIYSIMKGDTETGVSIMRIEPKRFMPNEKSLLDPMFLCRNYIILYQKKEQIFLSLPCKHTPTVSKILFNKMIMRLPMHPKFCRVWPTFDGI